MKKRIKSFSIFVVSILLLLQSSMTVLAVTTDQVAEPTFTEQLDDTDKTESNIVEEDTKSEEIISSIDENESTNIQTEQELDSTDEGVEAPSMSEDMNTTEPTDQVLNDEDPNGKYIVTRDSDGAEIGRFDQLQPATAAISGTGNPSDTYTITLTEDDLDMGIWAGIGYGYKVTLKSGAGGPYKIVCTRVSDTTNSQKHFSQVAGDLILENIILDGDGKGGGLTIMPSRPHDPTNTSSLTMKDGAVIQNCYDVLNVGAAVSTIGDRITITMEEGSAIRNNTCETNGGGIAVLTNNTLIMNGGIIEDNTSKASGSGKAGGGGVSVNGGTFIMNGGTIRNNSAESRFGGGIVAANGAHIEINGGTIQDNKASQGGGIYSDSKTSSFTINNATIQNNQSTGAGGGILSYAPIELDNCIFAKNTAKTMGGGLSIWAPMNITNTIFDGNTGNEGGGIFIRHDYYPDGTCSITNSQLSGNNAKWGGAIEVFKGVLNIEKSTLTKNETTSSGGAIFTNGDLSVRNSEISGNVAATVGGGIDARAAELTVDNTKIKENSAEQGGGGIFLRSDEKVIEATISNSWIEGNESDLGGGVYCKDLVTLTLENTNILGNNATIAGGGIYTEDANYNDPAQSDGYQNLRIDRETSFENNNADGGLYDPPSNATDFTNISFARTSLTGLNLIDPDHPFNNYDINYMNEEKEPIKIFNIVYDVNGGDTKNISFRVRAGDKTPAYEDIRSDGVKITEPARQGYTFAGWKPEVAETVTKDVTYVAQWEKIISNETDSETRPTETTAKQSETIKPSQSETDKPAAPKTGENLSFILPIILSALTILLISSVIILKKNNQI